MDLGVIGPQPQRRLVAADGPVHRPAPGTPCPGIVIVGLRPSSAMARPSSSTAASWRPSFRASIPSRKTTSGLSESVPGVRPAVPMLAVRARDRPTYPG